MSVNISPNSVFMLKCLGDIAVPNHLFLTGHAKTVRTRFGNATTLRVDLGPDPADPNAPPISPGVTWVALPGSSGVRFSCFENTFLVRDNSTNPASVRIASQGEIAASNGVMAEDWDVIDIDAGPHVRISCNNLLLNGMTVDGTLAFASDGNLSGTHWEVVSSSGDPSTHVPHGDQ